MMTKPMRGLVAQNLSKTYGERHVVENVSLQVQRGEVVGLLGPNGAGKTTTFSMLVGLVTPTTGRVFIDDQDMTHLPMYRRARLGIGYLPQEPSIFRGMTVEDNLKTVIEMYYQNPEEQENVLEGLLSEFMITHIRRASAMTLSGGERRRVEIARALANNPQFIMLDEPLAGIDPIAVKDIRDLITHLKDRQIGVLITDHNVRETLDIVDRGYIISDGKVLMEGLPEQIVADKTVQEVYLGDTFSR
jgi:lipopolysaccharide export system ATP-binding protein